jgi:hypothetical protein
MLTKAIKSIIDVSVVLTMGLKAVYSYQSTLSISGNSP